MRHHPACGLAVGTALFLAACGNGPASMPALSPGDIRNLTGLSAPIETAAAQQARQQENSARVDSLILSTMHVEVAGPDDTRRFRLLPECSGARCEMHDPVTGTSDMFDLAASPVVRGDAEAIGSAHGITLLSETGRHMGADRASLGAWMEHGSFGLFTDRVTGESVESSYSYALVLGDLTRRPLTESASWLGIMVGTTTSGDEEGDRLVGTAALNYDIAVGGLDAAFSGIRNIDRGTAHVVGTVIFSDLEVGPDGTFSRGQSGTRIHGGFQGPGHAEAAGIFEQSDIFGAFGATRQ